MRSPETIEQAEEMIEDLELKLHGPPGDRGYELAKEQADGIQAEIEEIREWLSQQSA